MITILFAVALALGLAAGFLAGIVYCGRNLHIMMARLTNAQLDELAERVRKVRDAS